MALTSGTRLGPYEVTGTLGAGGMGEVYRARDTSLGRSVAIKVLPEAVAHDTDRLTRFEREARTLAALNHPNIAAVYGLEKSTAVHALVMELVEGPTLADLIAGASQDAPLPVRRGGSLDPPGHAIPVDEALPIARQIAEALEAAHEQGIIHRDLKPANIKVRDDGTVKVLDFGLAKMIEDGGDDRSVRRQPDLSASPTITTPAMTMAGMILGTAAYMAPEQAKGRPADKRSDIWAFGCVLYEMLTGRRAFEGEDVTDTLAFVITKEPDWTRLPPNAPASVRRLLRRMLAKDRRQRLPDAAAARLEIDDALTVQPSETVTGSPQPAHTLRRTVAIALATAVVVAFAVASGVWLATRPARPRVSRLAITTSGASTISFGGNVGDVAITPDGSRVVYLGNNGTQLFVRALNELDPTPLTGLTLPTGPFVSPDGQWIGFFSGGNVLMKVAITGGPPAPVTRLTGAARGATWGQDDTIIFATSAVPSGLQRVSANGGDPTELTVVDRARGEGDHVWPRLLPGGRGVLFTVTPAAGGTPQVAVYDLHDGTHKILVRAGSDAHYASSGHLVYLADGALRAVAFDLERLEVRGTPVPVISQVLSNAIGAADFDIAGDGTLAYVAGGGELDRRTLVWVDRDGREQPLGTPTRAYMYPRLSPDGTRLAVSILDEERDIYTWDLARQILNRLTLNAADDRYPAWTPDGKRLAFTSTREGPFNLFWQAWDGSGAVERLTTSTGNQAANSFAPDGTLVLRNDAPETNADVAIMRLDGDRRVTTLLGTTFNERNGEVSPDGKWLAYESDESDRFEIHVRPFPDVQASREQVSRNGGRQPLWSPTGRELFFRDPNGAVVAVTVNPGAKGLGSGVPVTLVQGRYYSGSLAVFGRTYDVSADGKRFLMIKGESTDTPRAAATAITVVQNFFEDLKRLVPAD